MKTRAETREAIQYERGNLNAFFSGEHPDIGDVIDSIEKLIDLRIALALIDMRDALLEEYPEARYAGGTVK